MIGWLRYKQAYITTQPVYVRGMAYCYVAKGSTNRVCFICKLLTNCKLLTSSTNMEKTKIFLTQHLNNQPPPIPTCQLFIKNCSSQQMHSTASNLLFNSCKNIKIFSTAPGSFIFTTTTPSYSKAIQSTNRPVNLQQQESRQH